ncbi:MAG TPA: ABC transporter permease [Candidatus Limiplasma sp.]|nr:ABC transporter permease [Candidatus Limiplasma sp.]HPS80369.1 ABC transporter permease [Candidatus Limiplasma sp.]
MKSFLHRVFGGFYMFTESVSMSIANITQNRLRSFLTILGIMIGVTAVIALITTVSGVSTSISDSFTSMGAGTMTVSVTGNDMQAGLTSANMDEITALDHITGVTPGVSATISVARGKEYESDITIAGKNDYYFETEPDVVERGRTLTPIDMNTMARVCLIDSDIVDEFFYGVDPIGQNIYLNNLSFTVVGVLADTGEESISEIVSGTSDIYAPYTTVLKMNNETLVTSITVYIDDANASSSVQTDLGNYLDTLFSYEDDTYEITTMDSIQETMDSMLSMMSALLGGIASISLIVGGIGIMNMMLTSVTERTVEIGLKKAIGAEPVQIQVQFLIEAFLLSMIGGIMGVVLGIALSAILCHVMGTTFTVSYSAISLGVGFSAAVGILFGWSPARKASNLSPIDALRRM